MCVRVLEYTRVCVRFYNTTQYNTTPSKCFGRWFSTRFLHKCNRKLFGDAFFYSFASHAIHIERKGTRHSPMYMYIYLYTSVSYPDFNFGLTVTILRANTAERIASQTNTHSKQPTPTRYTIVHTISTYMRFPLFIFFRRLLVAAFADIYCFQQIVGGGLSSKRSMSVFFYTYIHTYISSTCSLPFQIFYKHMLRYRECIRPPM